MNDWTVLVRTRAYRDLRILARYSDLSAPTASQPSWVVGLRLPPGETLIGSYESPCEEASPGVVVTDLGLWVRNTDAWEQARYAEIDAVEGPPSKASITGLTIRRNDGSSLYLPVSGARGKLRDSFAFLTFVINLLGEVHRRAAANLAVAGQVGDLETSHTH